MDHSADANPCAALEQDYEDLLQFLYLSPIGVLQSDEHGEISTMNPVAVQTMMPIIGGIGLTNIGAIFERIYPRANRMIAEFEAPSGLICEKQRFCVAAGSDGAEDRYIELSLHKLSPNRLMTVVGDITETVSAQRDVFRKTEQLRTVCETMREYTIYTLNRDGQIDSWNKSGERMRTVNADDVIGQPFQTLLDELYNEDRVGETILEAAQRDGWYEFEGWVRGDGDIRLWCGSIVAALNDRNGEFDGYSVISRDLSDRKAYELNLKRMAETDALTGAPNRRSFMQAFDGAVKQSKACHEDLAFAMLDIDHFKDINDVFGHVAGDEALRNFVTCAGDALRSGDLLGRIGGEEFGMLLRGARRDRANALLERIRSLVEDNVLIFEGRPIRYTVSIGLAFLDIEKGETVEDLMARADDALYEAKRRGRNQISLAA